MKSRARKSSRNLRTCRKTGSLSVAVEQYSAERKAELLLSNTVTTDDYEKAREDVGDLGLDPDSIPHRLTD